MYKLSLLACDYQRIPHVPLDLGRDLNPESSGTTYSDLVQICKLVADGNLYVLIAYKKFTVHNRIQVYETVKAGLDSSSGYLPT